MQGGSDQLLSKAQSCTLFVTNRGQSLLIKAGSSGWSQSPLRTGLRCLGDRQRFAEIGFH